MMRLLPAVLLCIPAFGHSAFFMGGPIIDAPQIAEQLAQLETSLSEWRRSFLLHREGAQAEEWSSRELRRADYALRLGNASAEEKRKVSRRNLARAEAVEPRDACPRIGRAYVSGRMEVAYRKATSAETLASGRAWTGGDSVVEGREIASFRSETAALPLFGGNAESAPPNAALALSAMAIESLAPASPLSATEGVLASRGLTEAARMQSAREMFARVAKLRYMDRVAGSSASHRARQQALQADLAAGEVEGYQLFGLRVEMKAAEVARRVAQYESALVEEAALAIRLLSAAESG